MMDNKYMIVGPINYAMFQACLKFDGRDRRRIKREMNKASRRARRSKAK